MTPWEKFQGDWLFDFIVFSRLCDLGSVLASESFLNRVPQTKQFKTAEIHCLIVLEARILKSKCLWGHFPFKGTMKGVLPGLFGSFRELQVLFGLQTHHARPSPSRGTLPARLSIIFPSRMPISVSTLPFPVRIPITLDWKKSHSEALRVRASTYLYFILFLGLRGAQFNLS